jgi:hypothetical protein
MSGRSVAALSFACFLSAFCYVTPVVSQQPPFTPPSPMRPELETQTKSGNCLEVKGKSAAKDHHYCYYSYANPRCTTDLKSCQKTTGKCATSTNPPPCNPPPTKGGF